MIPRTNIKQHPLPDNSAFTAAFDLWILKVSLLFSSMDTVLSVFHFNVHLPLRLIFNSNWSSRARGSGIPHHSSRSRLSRVTCVTVWVSEYEYQYRESMSLSFGCRCPCRVAVVSSDQRRSAQVGLSRTRDATRRCGAVRWELLILLFCFVFFCSCAFWKNRAPKMLHIYGKKNKTNILLGGMCSLQLAHFPAKSLFFCFFAIFGSYSLCHTNHMALVPL